MRPSVPPTPTLPQGSRRRFVVVKIPCPTYEDVAREAGYAVHAVERAFDTRPNLPAKKRVSLHAGLAIMDAAERLGFVPGNRISRRRAPVGKGVEG